MIQKLQKKYALSEQGAKDLIKGCLACALQNISFMFPVGLLYFLVDDMVSGGVTGGRIWFYIIGCVVAVGLILLSTWFQYNATYFATYIESGVRRITLAEQLRKIPLSFFGKKDLADLTSTIMADCAFLETAFSHYIPELVGSIISTTLVGVCLFFYDWRMAIAALWVLPIAYAIVGFSSKVQDKLNQKSMNAKISCADGIQECIETVRDLKSNNAENAYLSGLDKKIKAVEKRAIISEFGTAVFVVSASMILKLGIASVALIGSSLLIGGNLDILTFFMFLLVVSRLYDPFQSALQNLAAVISSKTNIGRMNEILNHPVQSGSDVLSNNGCDIVFDHILIFYNIPDHRKYRSDAKFLLILMPVCMNSVILKIFIQSLLIPFKLLHLCNGNHAIIISIWRHQIIICIYRLIHENIGADHCIKIPNCLRQKKRFVRI